MGAVTEVVLMRATRTSRWWLIGVLVAAAVGCGDDDAAPGDSGADAAADAGTDAGTDSGPLGATCTVGIACNANADCRGGFCEAELAVSIPASGLPNGTVLEASLFPGGACSPTPFEDANNVSSCDLSMPLGRQGCGTCGVCAPEVLNTGVFSVCRERCEPESDRSGCSRPGYTCDFTYLGCVEGCRSDEECRLLVVDADSDGVLDSQRYDPTSTAFCDPDTFRCSQPGSGGASAGDPCSSDGDCEQDGRCILPLQTLAGLSFPGGYCSKSGCDISGLGCAGLDSTCVGVRGNSAGVVSTPQCMLACRRGAEADPDILGVDGHGAGCRDGYRCAWDGIHADGPADNGICVGGNYNDVTVNNVGAPCTSNAECYSPYGQGQCLRLSVGGIAAPGAHCAIMDCAAPGTPDDICGTGNECIGLAGDSSFCVQTCTTADECADGLACADDDGNPATPSICYPTCIGPAECRQGEACTRNVCT